MNEFDNIYPDMRASGQTLIRQCQLVMLRMLKITHYLCEKHGVQYFLVGGSLLGAIRHNGFIPWDDDLDIGMTRENYEQFVKCAVPELPGDIFFQTDETDPGYPSCGYVEARLRDKYSSYKDRDAKHDINTHQGLQVDIFVYDRAFLPDNRLIILENLLLKAISGSNKIRTAIIKRISKYSPASLVYASSYLQTMGMWNFGANYIKENELAGLIKTKFEDMEAYIPVGWNSCLKRQYKDYMQLPPPEKRQGHHITAEMADPFTPCIHKEVLNWKERHNNVYTEN